MDESAKLDNLLAENARLIALLDAHGIAWKKPADPVRVRPPAKESEPANLSTDEKVALFMRLFRGRTDVYPMRWESKKTGKSGYSPVCLNEWRVGVCDKPRVKCADCSSRLLRPLTDVIIYEHLAGKHTIGVYSLLTDDTCHFLVVDFDEADWREDARAFMQSCSELGVPAALEISRSGNGAHAWIFFARSVLARDARKLGTAIISHTCVRTRQLKLTSYDRLFPNQDTMPKGGFGNLIALPLQKKPREQGFSEFVDEQFVPFADQWSYLASIRTMSMDDMDAAILLATGNAHPLDVAFIAEEDQKEPWKQSPLVSRKPPGKMPKSLKVTFANMVYFEKAKLPQPLANRLIRLAAFQNPEFYKAQAMRLPVWDEPRVIGCADNYPKHIALPRGCLQAAQELLRENGIRCNLIDERVEGEHFAFQFFGKLRDDQEVAVGEMLKHDIGILCAPTAFGKTVAAAAMIARRGVSTLILVHRTELLKQWQERLQTFLGAGKDIVGVIGGGKNKPSGKIDIAVMQSLNRKWEVNPIVESYGHIIVDECHHLSAFSFEEILKRAKAKYVLGLTATPIRRDGRQPIIFMQCGPTRYTAAKPEGLPQLLKVIPKMLPAPIDLQQDVAIQEVFRHLATNKQRAEFIATTIAQAYQEGRKILVLTERTDHLDAINQNLAGVVDRLFVLHGRMPKKQRTQIILQLNELPPDAPRVLLATGKLVGEGFDHPPLDTLVLAMPISWKGTLQQYAGRLHREHAFKTDVRIYDYVDTGHPVLMRMWDRRQRGYKAMGYVIGE
ncbi:MAG: DEAD/DEAH box helicase family protein [Nitrosomonadales bacterium]|nr:DEAD/DEAH box helicase family protein [Nitrosomonadales bacterium]